MNQVPHNLKEISTRWSQVRDVNRFVLRYADAMRKYLTVILRNEDTANDVLQNFLVRVIQRGFRDSIPNSGRFRDYLTQSVRNAAINQIRSKKMVQADEDLLHQIESTWTTDSEDWRRFWTECLLQRAWVALEARDFDKGRNDHIILRYATDNPKQPSEVAAREISTSLEITLKPDAYRKQLSRARQRFADLLVAEVRETLEDPTEASLRAEVTELGLLPFVGKVL